MEVQERLMSNSSLEPVFFFLEFVPAEMLETTLCTHPRMTTWRKCAEEFYVHS